MLRSMVWGGLLVAEFPIVRVALIIGLIVGALLIGSAWLGAKTACSNGGGALHGWQCMELQVVGICDFGGKKYVVPDSEFYDWNIPVVR